MAKIANAVMEEASSSKNEDHNIRVLSACRSYVHIAVLRLTVLYLAYDVFYHLDPEGENSSIVKTIGKKIETTMEDGKKFFAFFEEPSTEMVHLVSSLNNNEGDIVSFLGMLDIDPYKAQNSLVNNGYAYRIKNQYYKNWLTELKERTSGVWDVETVEDGGFYYSQRSQMIFEYASAQPGDYLRIKSKLGRPDYEFALINGQLRFGKVADDANHLFRLVKTTSGTWYWRVASEDTALTMWSNYYHVYPASSTVGGAKALWNLTKVANRDGRSRFNWRKSAALAAKKSSKREVQTAVEELKQSLAEAFDDVTPFVDHINIIETRISKCNDPQVIRDIIRMVRSIQATIPNLISQDPLDMVEAWVETVTLSGDLDASLCDNVTSSLVSLTLIISSSSKRLSFIDVFRDITMKQLPIGVSDYLLYIGISIGKQLDELLKVSNQVSKTGKERYLEEIDDRWLVHWKVASVEININTRDLVASIPRNMMQEQNKVKMAIEIGIGRDVFGQMLDIYRFYAQVAAARLLAIHHAHFVFTAKLGRISKSKGQLENALVYLSDAHRVVRSQAYWIFEDFESPTPSTSAYRVSSLTYDEADIIEFLEWLKIDPFIDQKELLLNSSKGACYTITTAAWPNWYLKAVEQRAKTYPRAVKGYADPSDRRALFSFENTASENPYEDFVKIRNADRPPKPEYFYDEKTDSVMTAPVSDDKNHRFRLIRINAGKEKMYWYWRSAESLLPLGLAGKDVRESWEVQADTTAWWDFSDICEV